ncbi:hypothetical protein [Pseudoxanthomonas putridarboris]|uniref:Lipoprotein n=1 Tax=Pseudoxanthomonas putridarboris TaxID=752605 RepID=A0ABU9J4Q0_9GAMM
MRFLLAATLGILLSGCSPERVQVSAERLEHLAIFDCPVASGTYEEAEIEDLIAHPDLFDAKAIKVSGFYHSSFEHQALYPTPADDIFEHGLWILGGNDALKGKRIVVRGVYAPSIHGHLGQWPASICVHSVVAAEHTG